MIEIEIPNKRAFCGLISPTDKGLLDVLIIIGSISLSYHILIQFAPPAVRYPPINTINIISNVLSINLVRSLD